MTFLISKNFCLITEVNNNFTNTWLVSQNKEHLEKDMNSINGFLNQ